jgi:hypothetical protein
VLPARAGRCAADAIREERNPILAVPFALIRVGASDLRVLVVLEADTIVVTMPGTNYSISYRKLHDTPWLVASDVHDDPDCSKFTFRAKAWTAANDKARELGWIV